MFPCPCDHAQCAPSQRAAAATTPAGKHAEVLNYVIDELLDDDHPASEVKLKEVLGHTPLQVCVCVWGG